MEVHRLSGIKWSRHLAYLLLSLSRTWFWNIIKKIWRVSSILLALGSYFWKHRMFFFICIWSVIFPTFLLYSSFDLYINRLQKIEMQKYFLPIHYLLFSGPAFSQPGWVIVQLFFSFFLQFVFLNQAKVWQFTLSYSFVH